MKKLLFFLSFFAVAALPAAETDPFVEEVTCFAKEHDENGENLISAQLLEAMFDHTEKRIVYADEKIVSYRLERYSYSGGAHNNRTIKVGSIDRRTGKKLTLTDIVPGKKLAELDRAIKAALVKQKKVKNYANLMKQLQQEPKPIENFYFGKDGLHFIYNEYEIDCYAAGSYDVVVPWQR